MSKSTKVFLFLVLGVIILFFGGRYFIFWKIKQTVITKIEELKSKGILIEYESIDVNSFSGSIKITDVKVDEEGPDSICVAGATLSEIEVQGLSVISYLLKKKISIASIYLKEPWIQYSSRSRKFNSTTEGQQSGDKPGLKGIEIELFKIDSGKVEMVDSASCKVTMKGRLNLSVKNFSIINLSSDSVQWKVESVVANGIEIDLPTRFYNMKLQQVAYYQNDQMIQLDSLFLKTTLDRAEFAKRSAKQVDQFNVVMPSLQILGFDPGKSAQPSIIAREINLHFDMDVYRDKRYPRAWRKPKILPIPFLRKFSFPIKIDSLIILPSKIVYHEHPEKGEGVGKISFNELKGGMYNISNDSTGEASMRVYSKFMNAGDLNVNFTFPLEKQKLYTVKGSLTNFSMPSINTMLEPAAHIKIESGKMQAMKFDFSYDSKESNGELELRYSDLKVVAIKDDEEKSTNKIVTLIIGALIKKKIDKNDPIDKRTGTIKWERDTQKAILNYWWKSVFSGFKSVFGFNSSPKKGDDKKKKS
ncbi:MAG: DUF748 domain-containing protein [Cyclobacteriaceae bacterium]|nr:DUF748 domain-containing protein [Cyclobacteriaceae bacterium]